MYTIIERLDGSYLCRYRMQSDTGEFVEQTIGAAVAGMKQAAEYGNGDPHLDVSRIEFLREVAPCSCCGREYDLVPVVPFVADPRSIPPHRGRLRVRAVRPVGIRKGVK